MNTVVFVAGVAQFAGVGETIGEDATVAEGDGVNDSLGPGSA